VTLGTLAGVVIGYAGAKLLDTASERGWMTGAFQGVGILSLAILTYVVATLIGGNGFIAAFVGGMVFGHKVQHPCEFLFEFMETEGQLLMLITFLVFGAVLLPEALSHANAIHVIYALLSLTVIRVVPIVLSLTGSGVKLPTQLFLAWFGPRGLASILFVLLILEETDIEHRHEILTITVLTVALSILLHGVTAAPLANWFGRHARDMGESAENEDVTEIPLRGGIVASDEKH
ncbi:MAG: cation:proton antiporter, partial [Halioglobus sp.]|nr:cation:proton antiporter [Halioglobus sp.]